MSNLSTVCGYVSAGQNPCFPLNAPNNGPCTTANQPAISVTGQQNVSVTLGGTPPFNVTYTVLDATGGGNLICNLGHGNSSTRVMRVDSNTFHFGFFDEIQSPDNNGYIIYSIPGNSVIFSAVELQPNGSTATGDLYPYHISSNYTIVNSNSTTGSGSSVSSGASSTSSSSASATSSAASSASSSTAPKSVGERISPKSAMKLAVACGVLMLGASLLSV